MTTAKPFTTITMGDAAGIGPEIVLRSLEKFHPESSRPVVVGGFEIFRRAARVLQSPLSLRRIDHPGEGDYRPGIVNVLDTGSPSPEQVPFGKVSAIAGEASVGAIRKAHQLSLDHPVKAIVSAPLNKQSITEAGFDYGDECALMSDLTGAPSPMMLLISDKMRMATLSPLHVSLRKACDNVSAQAVVAALATLHASLVSFGIDRPKIAVAALNPHGGEGGMLGEEEMTEIIPGIETARKNGWDIRGPFPADSFFFLALKEGYDAVLTMYHDQGRIAMKTMDFGRIVIAMIGIPIPFLTVGHGTAHDIAGKGIADPTNLVDSLMFSEKIKA